MRPSPHTPGTPRTEPYVARQDSIDEHTAAPEWFKDAKFGVYWHWGAFTTPEYDSEWYPKYMYSNDDGVRDHHTATYGNPDSEFGYSSFITGGQDRNNDPVRFAPKAVDAGGTWNLDDWIQLIADSGARFAGPVAEHHDGFSMWDSVANPTWNSVRQGPGIDLLAAFTGALRARGIPILVAMHHAHHFNGFYDEVVYQGTRELRQLYGQLPRVEENEIWLAKLKEIIEIAEPDIIWQDIDLNKIDLRKRLEFLAYYYNWAETQGREVVATYKQHDHGSFSDLGQVADYERCGPAEIVHPYWLTDDTVNAKSWSYTQGMVNYPPAQIVWGLIDRVSKNGTMLLNISPTAAGEIPQDQRDILGMIGWYLSVNRESIIATRAWSVYGEGDHRTGGIPFQLAAGAGAIEPLTEVDSGDLRFTRGKDNSTLYVTALAWPDDGVLTITSLGGKVIDMSSLERVRMLATGDEVGFSRDPDALRLALSSVPRLDAPAFAFELSFGGAAVPMLRTMGGAEAFSGTDHLGYGGHLGVGEYSAVRLAQHDVFGSMASVRVADGYQLIGWSDDGQVGTPTLVTGTVADMSTVVPAGTAIVSATVRFDPDRWFTIVSQDSGLCLNGGGDAARGAPLTLWSPDSAGSPNLQWQMLETGDGYYWLANRTTGLVVDGGGLGVGSYATQFPMVVSPNVQWTISDGGVHCTIANRATGLGLDSDVQPTSGSPVKQWTLGDSNTNLRWMFVPVR